jgi:hypothetical protein
MFPPWTSIWESITLKNFVKMVVVIKAPIFVQNFLFLKKYGFNYFQTLIGKNNKCQK